MREIKFKAISKEVDDELVTIENFCYLGEKNHFYAEDLTNNHQCSVGIISVSQYIGVNDKNGVEIYEGDEVEILVTKGVVHKGVIVFDYGAFCLKSKSDLGKDKYNITALSNYTPSCIITKLKTEEL